MSDMFFIKQPETDADVDFAVAVLPLWLFDSVFMEGYFVLNIWFVFYVFLRRVLHFDMQ